MSTPLSSQALAQLFTDARTHNAWLDTPVTNEQIEQLYQLTVMGPTAFNCQAARFKFITSPEAKERIKPFLAAGNVAKSMAAPVIVLVGTDYAFYEHLPTLFTAFDAKALFADNPAASEPTAFRNASLQGAYLMMAARSLGLDCAPMSGFDEAGVTAEFFAGTAVKTNFIIALGYGDASAVYPRAPRPDFKTFASIL